MFLLWSPFILGRVNDSFTSMLHFDSFIVGQTLPMIPGLEKKLKRL